MKENANKSEVLKNSTMLEKISILYLRMPFKKKKAEAKFKL